jgi:hypothetical protein
VIANDCVGTVPLVAAGTPVNGKTIGPLTPGAAGPWICPAVAFDVNPEKLTLTVI